MSVIIERIESAGRDLRARRLVFSDFEEVRTTSAAVVRVLGLEEGDELERAELEERLAQAEPDCARERALRVLGYRDRSTAELSKRLRDDGYPAALVRDVVERLSELGLLDDARFAASWARTRAFSGLGPQRILRELREKGVADDVAGAVVAAAFEEEDSLARAKRVLGSAPLDTRADRDRAVRRLVRKGFTFSDALKATLRSEE